MRRRGLRTSLEFLASFICMVLMCPVGQTLHSVIFSLFCLFYAGPMIRSIMLLYLIFCLLSRHGDTCGYDFLQRRNFHKLWRNLFLWRVGAKYFPVECVKTVKLDEGPYLFVNSPHGVYSTAACFALISNGAGFDEKFPKIRLAPLIISLVFKIPFLREMALFGCLGKATTEAAEYAFSKGYTVILMPGGASEALLQPCKIRKTVPIVLKERRGFVRLAMKNKVPLVPTYSFGEHDAYNILTLTGLGEWAQLQMKNILSFSIPIFWGYLWYIPRRKRQKVVIGAPIRTDDYEGDLTDELVRAKHEEYKKALTELFEKHREDFYPKDYKMEFVDTNTIGFSEAWCKT